jgi:hypothetical protein
LSVERYRYGVDSDDRLRFVDESWQEFARVNDADELTARSVLGRPLWDFISSAETRELYRLLFAKARATLRPIELPFRCDSPDWRRQMRLIISPRSHGGLDLDSVLVSREEHGASLALLDRLAERGKALLRICGWCKKIPLEREWVEIEDAIRALRLFDSPALPRLTHSICPDCSDRVTKELESA